ncbi:MAG TPA: putative zinc-binding metallopeptidase [Bryobacteraceae bacterium]|nr:putative zinc-binding metallopeptidase [Bryobacteraceae bacterium]
MYQYRCQCGRPVFFRNTVCLACNTPLGFDPAAGLIVPLTEETAPKYRRCENLNSPSACNWLMPADETPARTFCISCRLNRTIPDLSVEGNGAKWRRIETAKRRLVASLVSLGLPVIPKSENAEEGLAFDFLQSPPEGPKVMTGHANGVITLNIEEADDAIREGIRQSLHEPYRTLLGHFRHESGHYYWDRLIAGGPELEAFRELFGDERADYGEALQRHYAEGAPTDWRERFVSAYAASHPWEDWAETWAHYLNMAETLDTAASFHVDIESVEMPIEGFEEEVLVKPDERFLHFVNSWTRFTAVMNELARSMGVRDYYPFVLSKASVSKLHFAHTVIESHGGRAAAREEAA